MDFDKRGIVWVIGSFYGGINFVLFRDVYLEGNVMW